MKTIEIPRLIATVSVLVASSAGLAQGQVEIGVAYPGVPFLYYTPQSAPSPTDYLYDRDRERISAMGSALQQQAAASQATAAASHPNAYFNRIRDYSGEETYHVPTRQSLSQRSAPSPKRSASRPTVLALDAYFLSGGQLDWPRDAPDSGTLHAARVDAEKAIKTVRDELRSSGKARAQSIGAAKWKLVAYGQPALAEIKSSRAEGVAVVFHYFLLFLHDSLEKVAGTGAP